MLKHLWISCLKFGIIKILLEKVGKYMKQIKIHDSNIVFLRKNNTYRILLTDTVNKNLPSFGMEFDLSQLSFLLKELSFLYSKKDVRPVSWSIDEYFYYVDMGYMSKDLLMISVTSTDSSYVQQTYALRFTKDELLTFLEFVQNSIKTL